MLDVTCIRGYAEAPQENGQKRASLGTLWAYATMGWEPGAGLMRVLEGDKKKEEKDKKEETDKKEEQSLSSCRRSLMTSQVGLV